jgi:hypothetical protein
MEYFLQSTFAVIYILIGMVLGDAVRMVQGRMQRTAPGTPPADPPPPADDPQRDPNWCHAHNQMQPCDGCRRS